ncbi:MAG: HAD family phosphatase [Atopobiaceae bacterium]|jgi:HAD superfamily hydrolase (TIGR01509 family)|nr:HAD family phosphatase [Atopobiaceae bacterium]MCH4180546.1 HAD family phosphatase [Atopobiaceae bacterium]MCH4214271.1 HAD family phosphatase [Atopobiaceae bacterium]MCH4229432.1 HAD family phosphatase [Atopobiaceae bacterium]MCH4276096.1 HAD family phosphatase [Atopobiaceae bacterium]
MTPSRASAHRRPELWPPSFDGAIFDFDGTLAYSGDIWNQVDHDFMARRRLTYTPDVTVELATLGFADGARFIIDRFGLDETVDDICSEWNDMASGLYAEKVELRAGAERYLRALHKLGIPCALATTNSADVLDSLMPRVDIDGLFDARVHGAEVKRSKHHPDIYLEAARRICVAPQRCIVFEDIAPGIASAQSVGMYAVAVRSNDPTQDEAELIDLADAWLEDWRDLF